MEKKPNILIIDDDPDYISLLKTSLKNAENQFERWGLSDLSIHSTQNGEDGLKFLDSNRVDLVLLDQNMPGMNGFETLKKIRGSENEITKKVTVIFITALFEESLMKDVLELDAYDFIEKSHNQSELMLKIKNALHNTFNINALTNERKAVLITNERLSRINALFSTFEYNPAKRIHQIMSLAGELLNADHAAYKRLEENGMVTVGEWNKNSDEQIELQSLTEICMDVVKNKSTDPFIFPNTKERSLTKKGKSREEERSYFGITVKSGNETIGVLCSLFNGKFLPSEEDKKIVGILGSAIGSEENRIKARKELKDINDNLEKRVAAKTAEMAGVNSYLKGLLNDYEDIVINLKESEEKSKAIAETASQPIIIIDDNGKINYTNPATFKTLGYTPEELSDEDITILMRHQNSFNHAAGFAKYIQSGESTINWENFQTNMKHKSGAIVPVEISLGEFFSKGKKFITGFIRDVTEQKNNERVLKNAKQEAENATLLKDRFIRLLSHDLIGLLSALMSNLYMMEESKLTESQRKHLEKAIQFALNFSDMIKNLLDVNRIKSGALVPRINNLFPCNLAKSIIKTLENLAMNKNITIINNIPDKTIIKADSVLLRSILNNIISNSIKFSNQEDTITLFIPENSKTTLAIKDTGIGIDPALIPDLFNYDVPTSTKGTWGERGTGLGLPICKDLMTAHGGKIEVQSKKGKGTTFFLQFPE